MLKKGKTTHEFFVIIHDTLVPIKTFYFLFAGFFLCGTEIYSTIEVQLILARR